MKVKKKVTLKKFIAGQLMHDKVGKIGTRSWLLRLAWVYENGVKLMVILI